MLGMLPIGVRTSFPTLPSPGGAEKGLQGTEMWPWRQKAWPRGLLEAVGCEGLWGRRVGVGSGSGKTWELMARAGSTSGLCTSPQPGLRHLLVTTVLYLRLSQAAPGASESLAGTAVEPNRKVGLGVW